MNKERLLKLAEVLEENSRGRTMSVPGDGEVDFDINIIVDYDTNSPCGTAACAIGYAGLHPWFRKRGLRATPTSMGSYGEVTFKRGAGYIAPAMAFFGINYDAACDLFDPRFYSNNPTPKQVAKRIRKFVAEHSA